MICDMHIHTHHSCDATASMEEYCEQALMTGVDMLCFTDHVDHNPNDNGCGLYNASLFFDEYIKARDRYSAQLTLLCGIEFSEPHVYCDEFVRYAGLPYDFILGSVHFWYRDMFPSDMVRKGIPADKAFRSYWNEVEKAVSFAGFDCFAHLDFPKRYYGNAIWQAEQMSRIFKKMNQNCISLEINTSLYKKGMTETMPETDLLALYKSCGGKYITIGSDAHKAIDLAKNRDTARRNAVLTGLDEVYYLHRIQKRITRSGS